YDWAGLSCHDCSLDANAAALMAREVVCLGSLAKALLANNKQCLIVVTNDIHTDHRVVIAQPDATNTAGSATHRACIGLVEPDCLTGRGADNDVVITASSANPPQFVTFI